MNHAARPRIRTALGALLLAGLALGLSPAGSTAVPGQFGTGATGDGWNLRNPAGMSPLDAAPSTPCERTWREANAPDPGVDDRQLTTVAALSPTDIWASGEYQPYSGHYSLLVLHFVSGTWNIVSTPDILVGYNFPAAMAATSSHDVWIVGGGWTPLVVHYDGTTWMAVPTPRPGGLCDSCNELYGVAALAPDNVWAVGEYRLNEQSEYRTLILHYNGSTWSQVPSPNVGDTNGNLLRAITAVAPNDIWAVGVYGSGGYGGTLALHYNGSSWSVVSSPSGPTMSWLYAAAALSTNDVWAAGVDSGNVDQTLTLHWDGAAWQIVPSPNVPGYDNYFLGLAAFASDDVWAAGEAWGSAHLPLVEHWDGTSWTIVDPSVQGPGKLNDIAATAAGDLYAVGWHQPMDYTEHTLVQVGHYGCNDLLMPFVAR